MIDFLNEYWWLAIALYVILFVCDHYMTVVGAKLHKAYAAKYILYQNGYELNPIFEKEVAEFQWFTRKHLFALLGGVFGLSILRLFGGVTIFEFFIGAYLLQWLDTDLLHLRNILFFRDIRKSDSFKGSVESSYWVSQRQSAARQITQAILFSIAALATMRLFFWGGVAGFLFQGFQSLYFANRKFPESNNIPLQKTDE
jgi:hypothetical protein